MKSILTVEQLSQYPHKSVASIRNDATRNPRSLLPICRLPGTKRLLWRFEDVEHWLAAHVEGLSRLAGARFATMTCDHAEAIPYQSRAGCAAAEPALGCVPSHRSCGRGVSEACDASASTYSRFALLRHRQYDFFVADILDASPKDDLSSMEHSLFALRVGDRRIHVYERM